VLISYLALVVPKLLPNFVIFHYVKVAKHIWDAATWCQKLEADIPSLKRWMKQAYTKIVVEGVGEFGFTDEI
jgi:hypothetical protein